MCKRDGMCKTGNKIIRLIKKKYYRFKSGEFLSLTEGSLSVVAELSETLRL